MSEKPPRSLGWQARYLEAEAARKELEDRALKAEAALAPLLEENARLKSELLSAGHSLMMEQQRADDAEVKMKIYYDGMVKMTDQADAAEARVKELEAQRDQVDVLLHNRAEEAEIRVKELEKQLQQTEEHLHPLLAKAHMRIRELEAERDDLLRLGNNHK